MTTLSRRKPILARIWPMFAMLFVFLVFAGGLWFFSVNEFKAPPARVVPVPEGFELIGGDTDGGSGGTTTRWVFLKPPEGAATDDAIDQLVAAMTLEGWESSEPLQLEGVPADHLLGLLRRGDEWAGLSSSRGVYPSIYELLDLAAIEAGNGGFVVVELGYSDFGVGRRCLVCD